MCETTCVTVIFWQTWHKASFRGPNQTECYSSLVFYSLHSGSECPAPISLSLFFTFCSPITSAHLSCFTQLAPAMLSLHDTETNLEKVPLCVGFVCTYATVYVGSFPSTLIKNKTFVYINWQIKMKTHQWNFDSVNTSHSQRGGRWKYLVLDLGVFEHPVAVKGCTAPVLMGSKGTFVSIKEQKSTGMHKRKEKGSFTVKAYSTARKGQRGLSNYKKCKLEFP